MLTLLKDLCILIDTQTLKDHGSMPKPHGHLERIWEEEKCLARVPGAADHRQLFTLPLSQAADTTHWEKAELWGRLWHVQVMLKRDLHLSCFLSSTCRPLTGLHEASCERAQAVPQQCLVSLWGSENRTVRMDWVILQSTKLHSRNGCPPCVHCAVHPTLSSANSFIPH